MFNTISRCYRGSTSSSSLPLSFSIHTSNIFHINPRPENPVDHAKSQLHKHGWKINPYGGMGNGAQRKMDKKSQRMEQRSAQKQVEIEATYPREMEAFTTEQTLLGDQGGKSSGVGKAIRLSQEQRAHGFPKTANWIMRARSESTCDSVIFTFIHSTVQQPHTVASFNNSDSIPLEQKDYFLLGRSSSKHE